MYQGELQPGVLCCLSKSFRLKLQKFLQHLVLQVFLLLLILTDGVFLICGRFVSEETEAVLQFITRIILMILLGESILRLICYDYHFFYDPWCVFDFVVVILCIIFEYAFEQNHHTETGIIVLFRQAKFLRVFINYLKTQRRVKKSTKKAVSGRKRRYQKDGYDLDITFITPRIFAMSLPASGVDSIYRNPCDEVSHFFKAKYKDRFRIYNCCPEKKYSYKKFNNHNPTQCIYEYFMEDHSPTPISQIIGFCKNMHEWLEGPDGENHVAAVHCRGGKGRTGTMISSYLIFSGYSVGNSTIQTAVDSMEYFKKRRTENDGEKDEGVQNCSQIRYIGYMERLMKEITNGQKLCTDLQAPIGPRFTILKFRVIGCRKILEKFDSPVFTVSTGHMKGREQTRPIYSGDKSNCRPSKKPYIDYVDFIPTYSFEVQNDVKVSWYIESLSTSLFGFWFHTYFEKGENVDEDEIFELPRHTFVIKYDINDVDGIRINKKKKRFTDAFPKYFECRTYFREKQYIDLQK